MAVTAPVGKVAEQVPPSAGKAEKLRATCCLRIRLRSREGLSSSAGKAEKLRATCCLRIRLRSREGLFSSAGKAEKLRATSCLRIRLWSREGLSSFGGEKLCSREESVLPEESRRHPLLWQEAEKPGCSARRERAVEPGQTSIPDRKRLSVDEVARVVQRIFGRNLPVFPKKT